MVISEWYTPVLVTLSCLTYRRYPVYCGGCGGGYKDA